MNNTEGFSQFERCFGLTQDWLWQELGSILQHFAFHHQGALRLVTTWFASLQLLQHLLFAISNYFQFSCHELQKKT